MSLDNSPGPSGFFTGAGGKRDSYANPFYGVAQKYIPLNSPDGMLWWANHFLLRFGFYHAALSRIANYFITSLKIECDDSTAKQKYKEIFDDLHWKQVLSMAGLNLLAYSNVFVSVNQGFERFLVCPKCGKHSNIDKLNNYKFSKKGKFNCKCPSCNYTGIHEGVDKPSKDLEKLNLTFWDPREIVIRFEETTGSSQYFWDIPKAYVEKVTRTDNKFFSKKTPKIIYDAIINERMLEFNIKNFVHLKMPTPAGIKSDGKSIPRCIYMFDDFFLLKVMERFNEAICMEDIAPFRVISMAKEVNGQANPILTQHGGKWASAVDQMIKEHRVDPASYHTFPFPLDFQQLGGDAKNLAPVELINNARANILNALNIPQELYNMSLTVQAAGPALRLFENSWAPIIDIYNDLLGHIAEVIAKIKGLPDAKVSLVPVTLSDDMERKSIIGQLVSANAIARSELLGLYGFDYREQIRKKIEEDRTLKELQQEEQTKEQLQQMADAGSGNSGSGDGGGSPQDVLEKAKEIAQQLFPLDAAGRRQKLQEIKASDETLYGAVKAALEQLTSGAKKSGVDNAKQQNNPPGA